MPSEETQFKPGQSGNPKGRPKGSRNKLSQAFIDALCDDFMANPDVLERLRNDNPAAYARVIASIIPKEMDVDVNADLSVREVVKQYVGSQS